MWRKSLCWQCARVNFFAAFYIFPILFVALIRHAHAARAVYKNERVRAPLLSPPALKSSRPAEPRLFNFLWSPNSLILESGGRRHAAAMHSTFFRCEFWALAKAWVVAWMRKTWKPLFWNTSGKERNPQCWQQEIFCHEIMWINSWEGMLGREYILERKRLVSSLIQILWIFHWMSEK